MGGDHGPSVVVPAVLQSLAKHNDVKITLIGDQDKINQQLRKYSNKNLQIIHTDESIAMDESPVSALRNKRKSSMRLAIKEVSNGQADACVSAGNTGALMVISMFVLKTLPGVERPALIGTLPTRSGKPVNVLDLGANVSCTPGQLFQFAIMGSVLSKTVDMVESPKVALLNVGTEDIKGNELVKQTAELLKSSPLINFVGYVEGDSLFYGDVDVVVCDGFVGNVALKTTEGVIKLLTHYLKETFKSSFVAMILAFFAKKLFKRIKKKIDPDEHNGASLIGLRGPVIKSHGGAGEKAFHHAIEEAIRQVKSQLTQNITKGLPDLSIQSENTNL